MTLERAFGLLILVCLLIGVLGLLVVSVDMALDHREERRQRRERAHRG